MKILILFIMFFLHIVDDYYLQGVLAKLKQKSFWEENYRVGDAPDPLYKNDYIVALLEHGFSWTFMVMLPALVWMFYYNDFHPWLYALYFSQHMILHASIDNNKANLKITNLCKDQLWHFCQVVIIWFGMFYGVLA